MNALGEKLCPWLGGYLRELERARDDGRLGHGWIFAGPRGTGKLNLALVFANRFLTRQAGAPPEMDPATIVAAVDARHQPSDRHPDLHLVCPEEGKKTIGVDRIREVIENVGLTAYAGGAKIVVIEPAEAMTVQAANALLKCLEEPAGGTVIILISHCAGRLPATIRSRCQTLGLRRPGVAQQTRWLGGRAAAETNPLIAGDSVGPIDAARRKASLDFNKYNNIDNLINAIYDKKTDSAAAFDECRNLEPGLILEWIAARVRTTLRARASCIRSNSVTAASADLTENRWHKLDSPRLFGILDDAGRLRDQLGTGLNEQLAIEVLLSSFAPH